MATINKKIKESSNNIILEGAKRPNADYKRAIKLRLEGLITELERLNRKSYIRANDIINKLDEYVKHLSAVEKEATFFNYRFLSNFSTNKQYKLLDSLLMKYKRAHTYWDIEKTKHFIENGYGYTYTKYKEGFYYEVESDNLMYVVYLLCRLADKNMICNIWKDVVVYNYIIVYKGKPVTKGQLKKAESDIRKFALNFARGNGGCVGFSNTLHNRRKYKKIKEIEDTIALIITDKE